MYKTCSEAARKIHNYVSFPEDRMFPMYLYIIKYHHLLQQSTVYEMINNQTLTTVILPRFNHLPSSHRHPDAGLMVSWLDPTFTPKSEV